MAMNSKRLSFRPRPLDIYKKLSLVTSWEDLDGGVSARGSSSNTAVLKLDGEQVAIEPNQVVASPAKKAAGGSDIPTPQFLVVDSYEKDYTPTFVQPQSYIRARPARSESAQYCEYDLDDDDEHWLNKLNAERSILPADKFELMLYKLEITDHHKGLLRDKDRLGPVYGIPTPIVLSKEDAIEVLKGLSNSIAVLRAVFDYWKGKRESLQKPILRRLQPAPPVNDSSPFNVFRPRERTHRPHTRRMQRRENDEQSFEKLRKIRNHFDETKQIMRLIKQREKLKRELVQVESNIQRLEMSFKVNQQYAQHGAVRIEDESGSRISGVEDGHHLFFRVDHPNGNGRPGSHATIAVGEEQEIRIPRRRPRFPSTRSRWKGGTKALENLEPAFLFTKPVDVGKLESAGIEFAVDDSGPFPVRLPGRIGRGGRLVFDRWNPLNQSPVGFLNHHFASKPFATPGDRDRPTRSSRQQSIDQVAATESVRASEELRKLRKRG